MTLEFDLEQVEQLAANGLNQAEIAKELGTTSITIRKKKQEFPELAEAIKKGQIAAKKNGKVKKTGRPKWMPPDPKVFKEYGKKGFTIKDIALKLGVSEQTLRERRREFNEIETARELGRLTPKEEMIGKLISEARDGSLGAIIFYLKTQYPHEWNEFVIADNIRFDRELRAKKELIREEAEAKKGTTGETGVLAIPAVASSDGSLKTVANKFAEHQKKLLEGMKEMIENADQTKE